MGECNVCVVYVFEVRETRRTLVAKSWVDHVELMHRGAVVLLRAAQGLHEILDWTDGVKEALNG